MKLKLKEEAKLLSIRNLERKPFQRVQKEIRILAIQQKNRKLLVNIQDIIFCKANGNYTEIHLVDQKKILVSKTLKILAEKLKSFSFLRTHQSYLINTSFIDAIGTEVTLNEGSTLPISRGFREKVCDYISEHTIEI